MTRRQAGVMAAGFALTVLVMGSLVLACTLLQRLLG
jgi:hypothetical protein